MKPTWDDASIAAALARLDGWAREGEAVAKTFRFEDYDAVIAFVNAVASIARRQDHHPELIVGYNTCRVRYTTHAAGGLTRRDFDAAAAVNDLLAP